LQGDGGDGTMFLSPNYMLASRFVIPMDWQHFTIVCSTTGTATIQSTWGASTQTVSMAGTTDVGAFYFRTGGGVAGTVVHTFVPCYLVVDSAANQDEVVVFPSLT
jgi:hypothetical protein